MARRRNLPERHFFQLLPAAKGIFFRRCLSGLIGTCFWVCRYSFKSFALGKAVFGTKLKRKERKRKKSPERQPVGGFPTQMCSSHVLWSQTGLGWSEGLTERCQAQTQSSILKGSAAKWEGTTSFLILSPLLKLSSCSEGGSTAGEGGGGLSSWY